MEPIDLTDVLKDYENKWVVLSEDNKVLYSADKLEDFSEFMLEGGSLLWVGPFDSRA